MTAGNGSVERVTARRRDPHFSSFIATGAVVGLVVGVLVALVGRQAPDYSLTTAVGYFGVLGGGLGALLGGLVAVLFTLRN